MENLLENVWNEIINDKYEVYYQPQYNNFTYEIVGFEALARLNDPEGLVSPSNFISVLEKNRMIIKLDLLIFESTCKFIKKCKDNNIDLIPVSVNLSRYDFYEDKAFAKRLAQIRKQYDVDPKLIAIEITEALSLENKIKAIEVVRELHDYDFIVILDNFDGKDKNLSLARDVRYDAIKLNMNAFNEDIINNNGKHISSIIDNANKAYMTVMSEKVETKQQIEFLKSINCQRAQGFYYAKPMAENDALNILSQTVEDPVAAQMQQLSIEAEEYKKKFEFVLEQLDIYFWEYIIATKEMHPCFRSIREFGLAPIVYNCPKSFIESGAIPNEYSQKYKDFYSQIDNGINHIEITIPKAKNGDLYRIIADTEFDINGKPIKAYCSAIKINKYK